MTLWLSAGLILVLVSVVLVLVRWHSLTCVGVTPAHVFTFSAILFTSGLDVGLIMFPLTEFAGYADITANPEYSFANPLAIEFGYWGFAIWAFYFISCFYFCVIEPKVRFFEIPWVKFANNMVIIGTCAFTAYLLLSNLPWYLPEMGDGQQVIPGFYLIVLAVIAFAVYSSSDLKYVRILSLSSTGLFIALIILLWLNAFVVQAHPVSEYFATLGLISEYFTNLHQFLLPLNDYHEFYLYWWFAWSIMIGQFTARFVGGLKTWQVLLAMLVLPSIPIALWFGVLYYYHQHAISTEGLLNMAMIFVGITFVINSLDSLIRLYTDNLTLTVNRLGFQGCFLFNVALLVSLTLLFKLDFLKIQWVGALVIGLMLMCFCYLLLFKRKTLLEIKPTIEKPDIDFSRIKNAH